ncbi:MAG: LexA family transcriptional regulator [Campylobacteraceae bacterium]|jgi:transcriptional regulator with XRE-family HTH domain|nr:LexA family transcriptional regulator [Campylobacteraceae bacterium]
MDIGKKIRTIRDSTGLGQKEFAQKIDISARTLQNHEYGETSPSFELLEKISSVYNVPMKYFIEDKPEIKSDKDSQLPLSLNGNIAYKNDGVLNITILSHNVSAGTSSDIHNIEVFDTHKIFTISEMLFKTVPKADNLRTTQVDGYSMFPMLIPESWVIFDITKNIFMGDGLYVLNWNNILMVKLLQLSSNGMLKIISANRDYESWEIEPDDQTIFKIFGRVLKIIH